MRRAFLEGFHAELSHLPGLALTVDQAARLFNIPGDVCRRLFLALEEQGSVVRTPEGRFRRAPEKK
jgi:hypothetical protein